MNILVLGAGGFIATHLVTRVKSQGHTVWAIDLKYPEYSTTDADHFLIGDLSEYSTFMRIADQRFDEVYQLAADMGGALYIFTGDNDSVIMKNNVQINLNLLKYLKETAQKPRLFYSSSACVYPLHNQIDSTNPICSENSAYPADPDSEYGWEKLFSERLFLTEARNTGLEVRIARYHNIYGPLGTWENDRAKSPAAICRKVIQSSGEIEIIGTGEQTRSFLYIDDCVDATILLTRSDVDFPLNIGSVEMVSINQLADVACSIDSKHLTKIYIQGPTGVNGRTSDNTLISAHLNWVPKFTLAQGIEKTYNWIKSQIKIVK